MISNPIYSSFRFYLPRDFIYDDVRQKIQPFYKGFELPFRDVVDYLNSTIITSRIPGIRDQGTAPQVYSGGQQRTFRSGLLPQEQVNKEITLTFKLKNSYLNWMILYLNMQSYLDARRGKQSEYPFLPNIYLHIFDDEDNILMEIIYKEIQLGELQDLDLRKQDTGIIARDFDLTLRFNKFEVKFNTDRIQSHRDDDLHVY